MSKREQITIYTCDRCGDSEAGKKLFDRASTPRGWFYGFPVLKPSGLGECIHLCDVCLKAFKRWLR